MQCRYYGELKLHDGGVVRLADRRAAEQIDAEFKWYAEDVQRRTTDHVIRCIQRLFALKLGDRYGWTTDKLGQLLKDVAEEASFIVGGECDMQDELDQLRENYRIDLMEDGMIRVEKVIDDNIYAPGEWRPLRQRRPAEGFYLITTDRGAVCTAAWRGGKFSGAAGAHAVAWRELPEAYEFWRDEAQENTQNEQKKGGEKNGEVQNA